jgi:hypothetical protein
VVEPLAQEDVKSRHGRPPWKTVSLSAMATSEKNQPAQSRNGRQGGQTPALQD